MLIFIDDSGDAGFKLDKGSSNFFVISMVIFDDELEAEKAAIAIKDLRRAIGFPDGVEFKFHKSSHDIKTKFLKAINPYNFRIRCIVVDKKLIHSTELKENKDKFYSFAIKTVLKYSDTILNAKIKIDGSGDREFRRNFLTYLRRELNSSQKRIIKNCKLVDSKNNVLIQMADMIAGTIRRSHDISKPDKEQFKNIIKKHIESEWNFK